MPSINAGSMADIAFLLLIFFLVATTIPNDVGIARKLPGQCQEPPCHVEVSERNILRISLNKEGKLLVENTLTNKNELRELLKKFIDNNGDNSCAYCSGRGLVTSSDNPDEAIISLTTHRETPYKDFISVQNELTAAYKELRQEYVKKIFQKDISLISDEELARVKAAYPFRISEAEMK